MQCEFFLISKSIVIFVLYKVYIKIINSLNNYVKNKIKKSRPKRKTIL